MTWLKRSIIGAALGLAPAAAMADPITALAALAPLIGGTAAAFVISYGGYILAGGLLLSRSASARRKQRRMAADARAQRIANMRDRSATTFDPAPPWQIVYGRATVPGTVLAWFHSDKAGVRENGDAYTRPDGYVHFVVEWAHHESTAINEVFVDGAAVGPTDGSGRATSGDFFTTSLDSRSAVIGGGGFVDVAEPVTQILNAYTTTGPDATVVDEVVTLSIGNTRISGTPGTIVSFTVQADRAAVRLGNHLGASDQGVDTYLNSVRPDEWTTDHRLRGVTYSVITLDQEDRRFQGGNIPAFTADLSGRAVYDPRTGDTAWSANPALCIRDWLKAAWGYGVTDADIDDTHTIAAANACDVQITLDDGLGPYTAARYTLNGPITTDLAKESVLDDKEESMAGRVVYGARWMIQAGAWTAPVTLPGGGGLTDDDLDGMISIVQADTPMDELVNGVRGTYIPATLPAGTGSGYLVSGAHAIDATTITLSGGTGTILAGNGVRFVGDDNTYVVTSGITAPGTIAIQEPGLMQALANNVVCHVVTLPKSAPTDIRPPYQNATFLATDGEPLWDDIELPFTNSGSRARNIARIRTEQRRSGQIIRFPAKLRAITLQVGDRIPVTSSEYGYTADTYWRVTDRQFGLQSPVTLTLQEDAEDIWDEADAATADPTPNTRLPNPWSVGPITGLAATSDDTTALKSGAGVITARVQVTWNAVTDRYVADGGGRIEVLWRVGEEPWRLQNETGDSTSAYIIGPKHDDRLVIEVRAVNGLGKRGPSSFLSHTVDGPTSIGTPQLADGAATKITTDRVASVPGSGVGPELPLNAPCVAEITLTATAVITSFTSAGTLAVHLSFSGGGTAIGDLHPVYEVSASGQQIQVMHSATIVTSGSGPWLMETLFVVGSGTFTPTITDAVLRVTEVYK